jgi:hypothetical protein
MSVDRKIRWRLCLCLLAARISRQSMSRPTREKSVCALGMKFCDHFSMATVDYAPDHCRIHRSARSHHECLQVVQNCFRWNEVYETFSASRHRSNCPKKGARARRMAPTFSECSTRSAGWERHRHSTACRSAADSIGSGHFALPQIAG